MSASKKFASQADLEEKKISFTKLSDHAYAYTAEGDPNTGIIIGDDAVLVADTQATPAMAQDVVRRIREVTDKPIKYVVLTHYHAVRVLGASGFNAQEIIASQDTYDLIVERGEQDKASEIGRFPRLFRDVQSVPPGMTWPTITFNRKMTLWMGKLEVRLLQLGRGHTKGDTVLWLPQQRILFSGDLVEYGAAAYTGDAQLEEWPATLEALRALGAEAIVPGRGEAMKGQADVNKALDYTKRWVEMLFAAGKEAAAANMDLKAAMAHTRKAMDPVFGHVFIYEHCLPFDVSRAFDEAKGIKNPRIWTAERDKEMWAALQA